MAFLWDLADHLGTYVTHTQYGTHCMYGSNIRAIWLLRVLDRRSTGWLILPSIIIDVRGIA